MHELDPHPTLLKAIGHLAAARREFHRAVGEGLILGNDNHIGDVGEYWARRHFEARGEFRAYHPKKNGPFDFDLKDGRCVSVKTMTAWSKTEKGTQVKELEGAHWHVLAAIYLGEDLMPDKIAIVPLDELLRHDPFPANVLRRGQGSSSFPRFEWWSWLEGFVEYRRPGA